MMRQTWLISTLSVLLLPDGVAVSEESLTIENVTAPAANTSTEPLAEEFSLSAATRFLDVAALDWTKSRKCFACHTNYCYLMARPAVSYQTKAHQQIRAALEKLVEERWETEGPRWDAEVVMSAAVLAMNDAATTGELQPTTRKALDRMWSVQRDDGGFEWQKCNWPPMESDDHYGATIALLGVGAAPGDYAATASAQRGIAGLRKYLQNNPPSSAHHQAMLLWSSTYVDGIVTDPERAATVRQLRTLQKDDGGWATATLGDWERADKTPQDTESSDGYATGFVLFVLRRAGLPEDHPAIAKGIAWLKSNQRASGRWFTRSLNRDNQHFLSHAGTAFAILALTTSDSVSRQK